MWKMSVVTQGYTKVKSLTLLLCTRLMRRIERQEAEISKNSTMTVEHT